MKEKYNVALIEEILRNYEKLDKPKLREFRYDLDQALRSIEIEKKELEYITLVYELGLNIEQYIEFTQTDFESWADLESDLFCKLSRFMNGERTFFVNRKSPFDVSDDLIDEVRFFLAENGDELIKNAFGISEDEAEYYEKESGKTFYFMVTDRGKKTKNNDAFYAKDRYYEVIAGDSVLAWAESSGKYLKI